MLLELLDHAIEIGIAGAKAPCEPVPVALGSPLAVSDFIRWLMKTGVSDNAGSVKYFLSVLTRALRRARHFALVEGSAMPTKARS